MLGENILKLRKKNGLSQEKKKKKINVTRQTISNWELGETAPNPEQLKLLSQSLNITIDELLDNDINSSMKEKIINIEKTTNIGIKVMKFIGIAFAIMLIIDIISFIIFMLVK